MPECVVEIILTYFRMRKSKTINEEKKKKNPTRLFPIEEKSLFYLMFPLEMFFSIWLVAVCFSSTGQRGIENEQRMANKRIESIIKCVHSSMNEQREQVNANVKRLLNGAFHFISISFAVYFIAAFLFILFTVHFYFAPNWIQSDCRLRKNHLRN